MYLFVIHSFTLYSFYENTGMLVGLYIIICDCFSWSIKILLNLAWNHWCFQTNTLFIFESTVKEPQILQIYLENSKQFEYNLLYKLKVDIHKPGELPVGSWET